MKKAIIPISIVCCCFLVGLAIGFFIKKANSSDEIIDNTQSIEETTSKPEESEPEPEPVVIINPFNGEILQEPIKDRPIAVMVNNAKVSMPQRGISEADIIYDMPVEWGITRLMAVFSSYKSLPDIGSIRSARHDYVELIAPYKPMYLHFGGSDPGKEAIKQNGIDHIDGLDMANLAFYQVKSRLASMASEHTWFSNSEYMQKGIDKKAFSTEQVEEIAPIFSFTKPDESAMAAYTAALPTQAVTVKQTGATTVGFTYNAETGLYERGQYGKPHIDETTGKAAAIRNVLIMYTGISDTPNKKNKEIALESGKGYYLSEGKRIEVTFKKPSISENLKVFDAAGSELSINVGKTWVCVAEDGYYASVVFG